MSALGTAGLPAGWLALVLAALQMLGHMDVAASLPPGLLSPACLLAGFWLGYLARLAVHARYELRAREQPKDILAGTRCRLPAWRYCWQPGCHSYQAGRWPGRQCYAGTAWIAAGSFMFYVDLQKPELKRPLLGE